MLQPAVKEILKAFFSKQAVFLGSLMEEHA